MDAKIGKLILDALKGLDTGKIAVCMETLQWRWVNEDGGLSIPTERDILLTALKMLIEAYEKKATLSCGGFTVAYINYPDEGEGLSISFVITESDAFKSEEKTDKH